MINSLHDDAWDLRQRIKAATGGALGAVHGRAEDVVLGHVRVALAAPLHRACLYDESQGPSVH
jgi:hypothetical protein